MVLLVVVPNRLLAVLPMLLRSPLALVNLLLQDAQSAAATGSVSALATGVQQMGIGLDPARDSPARPILRTRRCS